METVVSKLKKLSAQELRGEKFELYIPFSWF
jgi:hypothetical protein